MQQIELIKKASCFDCLHGIPKLPVLNSHFADNCSRHGNISLPKGFLYVILLIPFVHTMRPLEIYFIAVVGSIEAERIVSELKSQIKVKLNYIKFAI